jgi:hypothetical protein
MKTTNLFILLLVGALATAAFGQPQKTYNWVPGNDETVRLDPGYYHTGLVYEAGWAGKKVQVDVNAEQPVTLAMVLTQDWNAASQHTETLGSLSYTCAQEHVVKATYTCDLPPNASRILLIRDERTERGAFAGIGEVIAGRDHDNRGAGHDRDGRDAERRPDADRAISTGIEAALSARSARQWFAPNNVHVQYYDWSCAENCNLPDPPHERIFNWVPVDDATLRLDPGDYAAPRSYDDRVSMRVDVVAQQPVSVLLMRQDYWKSVNDPNPAFRKDIRTVETLCAQQRTVKISYGCTTGNFFGPWILLIRDERQEDRDRDHRDPRDAGSAPAAIAIPARNGSTSTVSPAVPPSGAHIANANSTPAVAVRDAAERREFASPNEVHIQYYGWQCVAYCDQPVFQWVRQVNEKYQLTKVLKVYSGITADHDGAEVSIKVKSPVPMAVAILPSKVAGQLFGKPEMFESAVENSSCQQRGVQSSTFQCQFNVADGPQTLVLLTEPGSDIPAKKKVEVVMQAVKCVENCDKLRAGN